MANCFLCKAEIVFDNEHIGRNGKKIPLDPFTKQPHDCPMREKKFTAGESGPERVDMQEKDDHGNELVQQMDNVRKRAPDLFEALAKDDPSYIVDSNHDKKYVDHTAKGASKVQIFSNETKADTQAEYNEFLRINNGKIKTQGAHDHVTKQDETEPLVYSIYLYYEETK